MIRSMCLALMLAGSAPAFAGDIKLVNAGSGKKATLSYMAKVGATQKVKVVRRLKSDTEVMGLKQVAEDPLVTVKLSTAASVVSGGNKITYTYDDVALEAGPGSFTSKFAGLKGMSEVITVSSQGVATAEGQPKGLDMSLWTVPLPAEPVAVGGSWTFTDAATTAEGQHVTETKTITLDKVEGDVLSFTVDLVQQRQGGDAGGLGQMGQGSAKGHATLKMKKGDAFVMSGSWEFVLEQNLTIAGNPARTTTYLSVSISPQ